MAQFTVLPSHLLILLLLLHQISVIFISLDIINGNAGSQTLRNLSIAMNVLRHRALRSALTLCHFMVEDKDVIAMLALGLPGMAKEMMCVNALRAANRMGKQLSHKGIACSMGVSTVRVPIKKRVRNNRART